MASRNTVIDESFYQELLAIYKQMDSRWKNVAQAMGLDKGYLSRILNGVQVVTPGFRWRVEQLQKQLKEKTSEPR